MLGLLANRKKERKEGRKEGRIYLLTKKLYGHGWIGRMEESVSSFFFD